MKARVAREVLQQEVFDSSALTPLCTVVHIVKAPGQYAGEVCREDKAVGTFRLEAGGASAPRQVTIDLASIRGAQNDPFTVQAPGASVFYVSRGKAAYSVQLRKVGDEDQEAEFDSRSLGPDDLFTVTLLHPGNYDVADENDQTLGQLKIDEVTPGKKPYRPPPPKISGPAALTAKKVSSLNPAQTQVFHAEGRTRIRVNLLKPTAAKVSEESRKVRWPKKG
jgi:hypothetical protein